MTEHTNPTDVLTALEAVLCAHPTVADCAVLPGAPNVAGSLQPVAYVVPTSPVSADALGAHIRRVAPELPPPVAVVAVASIPVTGTGEADADALAALEIVDSRLVTEWENAIGKLDGVREAAVVCAERVPAAPIPLHLGELLGAEARVCEPVEAADREPARPAPDRDGSVPAISDGGPLDETGPQVLADILADAADAAESADGGILYVDRDGVETVQSYAELRDEAQRVLGGLRAIGLRAGDRALLELGQARDFIPAFWGCVLGGIAPVPLAAASGYREGSPALRNLETAWKLLRRPVVLTDRRLAGEIRGVAERTALAGIVVEALEDCRQAAPAPTIHRAASSDVALLMLTSGSTGTPKGVMLSHRNLLSRAKGSIEMNGFGQSDVSLNWMPLDHVAGLIYFHLRDVQLGCRQLHVATDRVLEEPLRWLDLLERHRVTVTFAPNFAFGLVNDRIEASGDGAWDLSAVRYFLNGAEAIVPSTARRFLELLAPHGLRDAAMRPAWGMSETSSGVTYGDIFTLSTTRDDDAFAVVGRPIPGVRLRVVDDEDQLLAEGEVGRLQVAGATLTRGYFDRPDLDREAFTADGWFATGDLAILRGGRLTITGREKDVVIVNSVKYYSHAIESAVESVEGVETSFTAACAIRDQGSDTDRLALFFHPEGGVDDPRLGALLREIQVTVAHQVGIAPDHLIPVEQAQIPKTSIGKIQRTQLADGFRAGRFEEAVIRADRALGNASTLPDWFLERCWRRREAGAGRTPGGGYLVLAGAAEPATTLCAGLQEAGVPWVRVDAGEQYAVHAPTRIEIDPACGEHYRRLFADLADRGFRPARVVDLRDCRPRDRIPVPAGAPSAVQVPGASGLLHLVSALADCDDFDEDLWILHVTRHGLAAVPGESVDPARAAAVGVIRSVPFELPSVQCRHLDLEPAPAERHAEWILTESRSVRDERQVAYREGHRLVAALKPARFEPAERRPLPFLDGGAYLITGGLGGIGQELARHLLTEHAARVLLIGRTALTGGDPEPGAAAWALSELKALPGEVSYEIADVCDAPRLRALVAEYEARWSRPLDGLFHLAGSYHEAMAKEEAPEAFWGSIAPRLLGARVLDEVLGGRDLLFVASTSVAGHFGGAGLSAYAAANAVLDAYVMQRRAEGAQRHYAFAWSTWEDIGQSRSYHRKDLPRTRGFLPMPAEQAVRSMLVGLRFDRGTLLVGLDQTNRHVRRQLWREPWVLERLVGFHAPDEPLREAPAPPRQQDGRASTCDLVALPALPRSADGEIDREQLIRLATDPLAGSGTAPQTGTERRLAELWARVLSVPPTALEDDFFALGGDSLLGARLLGTLADAFGVDVGLRALLENSSLGALAALVDGAADARSGGDAAMSRARAGALLERVDELSDEEVSALLNDLEPGEAHPE